MVPAVAVSSLLGLRTVFQLAHHCVWFISMRSSWMGVTGKTLQHKFNFYSILGETFGPRRHVASDKTASHKSVINHIVLLGLQPSVLWDVLRYCSDSFAQVGQLGHSFKVLEESVPKSASDPSAKAYRLEFFPQTQQIDEGWRQKEAMTDLSFDIFCLFLSSYCIFYLFLFSSRRLGFGIRKVLELELQMPLSKNNRNNSRRHRMVDDVMCLVPVPFFIWQPSNHKR